MKRAGRGLLVPVTVLTLIAPILVGCAKTGTSVQIETLEDAFVSLEWIAYSPTNADPNQGMEPTVDSIRDDLAVLREVGFTGLVTYSSTGVVGSDLPQLAEEAGFQGLIVGIWDLENEEEIAAAKASSESPIVLGYSVGNEGLHERYEMSELRNVIEDVRSSTGKPATTTEQVDDYYTEEDLLSIGDWVFPNAHPYFHSVTDPDLAVTWTEAAFDDLASLTAGQALVFKEVGLPTGGDTGGQLSEEGQKQYYLGLAVTDVDFVYFEAFDMTWKTTLPVEPHWGLFRFDRTPKEFACTLMTCPSTPPTSIPDFVVYSDMGSLDNHFTPSGYMGDVGDITINEVYTVDPHSGATSIKVAYTAEGQAPNECSYLPPCGWAGVYWQEPPNNWGIDAFWKDHGYDLSGYSEVTFWARAEQDTWVKFMVGGINGPNGDSLIPSKSTYVTLTPEWEQFSIDLQGEDLSHIIGGFGWVWTAKATLEGGRGGVFFLDDIQFEQ